jgi:hypothetical protein
VSDKARRTLKRCPAATAGYQLFRQQALAEAIAKSGSYKLVVSSVAFDERNDTLIGSLRTTGLGDFRAWGDLFEGQARFVTFTHQQWVSYVYAHGDAGEWGDWLTYVGRRYGYVVESPSAES